MYETVEVPFKTQGNRQYLTAEQAIEFPYVLDFIKSFPACFEFDVTRAVWVFYPDGDAPV